MRCLQLFKNLTSAPTSNPQADWETSERVFIWIQSSAGVSRVRSRWASTNVFKTSWKETRRRLRTHLISSLCSRSSSLRDYFLSFGQVNFSCSLLSRRINLPDVLLKYFSIKIHNPKRGTNTSSESGGKNVFSASPSRDEKSRTNIFIRHHPGGASRRRCEWSRQ